MSTIGDRFPIHLGPGRQRWVTLKTDTERIGEQLGRAIAPMIDDLGDALGAFAAWRNGDFQCAIEAHRRLTAYEDAGTTALEVLQSE